MSSVLLTVPSVEFSIGTTPKSAAPASTSWKHLLDRGQRQRAHRVTEVLQHRLLRERALGPEKADLERFLLREAGGHDLAEQPQDLLVAQRTALARLRSSAMRSTCGFALRAIEVDGVPGGVLRNADLLRELARAR